MSPLVPADLIRFFKAVSKRVPCNVTLVLTGGGEALLLGGARPTGDADFGITLRPADAAHWPVIEQAISAASQEAGVAVQYCDDIDRWSMISIPPRRRRTRPYRRFGRLTVHLLDPTCWAVYKLARYLDSDVDDLCVVLRNEGTPAVSLARLCGAALRSSPKSTSLHSFRLRVEHFFRSHGAVIWGSGFKPESAIGAFRRAAGIDPGAGPSSEV